MRILAEESAALLIDIQEKLYPAIHGGPEAAAASIRFIRGLQFLEIPILAVRQYPKGLGDLIPEVKAALGETGPVFDKITFSAGDDGKIVQHLGVLQRKNIFVLGMEAHVCVLQSVIDLAALGYLPVLVCDCIGSRNPLDMEIAMKRAEREGAYLTTSEAALFELLRKSGSETFKAISSLVK